MKLDETEESEPFDFQDAVELAAVTGQPLTEVAKSLGVTPCIHEWTYLAMDGVICSECGIREEDAHEL